MKSCILRHGIRAAFLALVGSVFSANAEYARPGFVQDKSRPFNEYVWITAHNSFNFGSSLWAQQRLSVGEQLERGVRGLMMDLHQNQATGQIILCHGCTQDFSRVAPWGTDLATVQSFLSRNRDAVVTLHLESYVTHDAIQRLMDQQPHLFNYNFNPTRWATPEWPTLQQMIDRNERLVILTNRADNSGSYSSGKHYLFHDQEITVENTFSIGGTIFTHDWACSSRWSRVPLSTRGGMNGWTRLFVMNQFHSVGERAHAQHDNRWDKVEQRADNPNQYCLKEAGRIPNYIALDHIDEGDALEYAEYRNNGGIVAYEGNDGTQNVVCGFSTAVQRRWSIYNGERLGCENDEMRSFKIRGAKARQRVTFYDLANGYRDDDFSILNIERDIPWDRTVTVSHLEQSVQNADYRLIYSGGNGLNGKVSHINVEPQPADMSDSVAVLLNGYNGTGRVSCSFGLTSNGFWNIKNESHCHNDDAKSVKIMVAKAGTRITVYDSPSGSTGDDYTTIRVNRFIGYPVIIGNLESSRVDGNVTVTHHHHNGLNGKVSSVRVQAF